MAVVEKAAVAVDAGVRAFVENTGPAVAIKAGGKVRARSALHAVGGPKDLREAVELDHGAGRLARMIRRETAVIRRVPVLGGHDEVEGGLQTVEHGNDFIASGDGQGATGKKVILQVYDEQGVHWCVECGHC